MRRAVVLALGAALLLATGAREAPAQAPGLPELRANARQSRAEQLRATREYKASLDRLLAVRESEVQRRLEQLDRTRALVERGLVARGDLGAAERAASAARARLDEAWNEAVQAASLIAKSLAQDELASARALSPGSEQSTATLVRFRGERAWSLGLTGALRDFFTRTFGRALPVSAYGQTPLHDKLGFDHRNAVDLAVHPDTPEGKAVMDWLRRSGLSFIAFRGAVAGAATGAHIHVGEPSQRLASP
ncbi:MAG: hypothetical protein FJ027_10280 [Candidatus Rokubacteria bacterium]|nr:hypothetical protein [Candidatus Rokubacteria bacterium]